MTVLETTFGTALRDATVELPAGLVDAAPTKLQTIRAGEEVLIAARFAGEVTGEVVLRGTLAGQPFVQRYPITLTASTAAGNGFVPRMWAAHAIDELERAGRGEDRARIVALSQGYGVLSRQTSLLVLESDAMFDAFGIDRAPDAPLWTGSEALDEVSADGTVAYADGADDIAPPAKPSDSRSPRMKSPSSGDGYDDDDVLTDPFASGKSKGSGAGGVSDKSEKEPDTAKAKKDSKGEANKKRPAAPPRGPGEWMKKVYFRVGAVSSYDGVSDKITQAVAAAETALKGSPDSRDRHRSLVQALSYAGELDRAATVAKAWLERDALDPQALDYLAGILGRQGRRDEALRVLGGVVDLAPDDAALQLRLARADERAGRTAAACSHRVAHASLLPDDAAVAGAALRCLRALGRETDATVFVRGLGSDQLRDRAEAAADKPTPAEKIAGDLVVNAQWTGSADVDLTIITPQGQRVSWMGGRADVTAAHAGDQGREQLALKKVKKGRYLVELSRTVAGDTTPVRGTIEVEILGVTRSLAFDLSGDRATLGRVVVSMDSKLVPIR
jgi:tetratricopeptide (TPR) repeat protein